VTKIKNGWGTYLTLAVSILGVVKPLGEALIGIIENTAVHWTTAEKTGLITGAAVAVVLALTKAAQAIAAIIANGGKGGEV
jgi:hypothetical protein